ncbi:MAG: Glyoxylase, beta-lactamase superfamily II [Chloroflexi bacterium]|nr:MAG: Glyoxylase, beta-lactamase superfamily II [Chloroflexota bacterium]
MIDTPAEPSVLVAIASTTQVKYIAITHNHMDHLLGFEEVTKAFQAKVVIGESDSSELPVVPDLFLEDGKEIRVGDLSVRAIHTPGHTKGSTCLLVNGHLFTGDTLFPGGPGKTKSPDSLKEIIVSITSRLFSLGDDVFVYPGHGDDGLLGTARKEYEIYSSKTHPDDLFGDVEWLKS